MAGEQITRLVALLERDYGRVAAMHPIVEYGVAEGGVYRVDRRDASSWVVRLFSRSRSRARVQGDAAVLAYVGRHDVPAESLVPTRDSARSVDLNGQGVVVTRFLDGTRPDRSLTTLRRLGEAVGRLHALPPAPDGDRWLGRRAGAIPAEDLPYGRACLNRVAGRVPAERLSEHETLHAALDATDDCEALPSALTHSDCHLDNALLTPDGRCVLIDWVGSGQGPRVAALGVLLYSCAVRSPGDTAEWPDGTDPAWMRLAVEAVVDGYCRFRVLTQSELERLADAVRIRPLVIAAREFAASIERGEGATPDGWWTRYAAAETVAAHAQAAMEHHREPIREST